LWPSGRPSQQLLGSCFQHSTVDDAIDQWRKRLEACIDAEGGHFEHALAVTLLA